jgi:hypothetical protein
MRILIVVAALFLGCGTAETDRDGWFCHSPGTELHNGPCVDECIDPGDPHSYCYCELGCFGISEYE